MRSPAASHLTDGFWHICRTKPKSPRRRSMCGHSTPANHGAPAGPAVQVTNLKGGAGGMTWRQDGKEIYFVTRDREVMAVDVTLAPKVQAGTPRRLFQISDPLAGAGDVSPDGQRFIVAMPVK